MPQTVDVNPYAEGGPGRCLKTRLRAGEVLVGGIVAEYARPSLAKLYRQAGFDFVYIEYEHAFFGAGELTSLVQTCRDNALPPIAKTPQLERAEVAKLLECGIVGIQLPRTETPQEVEKLIEYLKFPPLGTRAIAPGYGNSDYLHSSDWGGWMREQDEEATVVLHIETRVGYQNASRIISTPGIDMVYVGPGDFSVEMGHPGNPEHPDVRGPMAEMLAMCREHGVAFGTTAVDHQAALRWVEEGALFFETADERDLILKSATELVDTYRDFLKLEKG